MALQITNHCLLQHTTNTSFPLPALTLSMAHLPLQSGGLGYRDHIKAALPTFLVPIIQSILYSTTGIPYCQSKKTHSLAPIYAKKFSIW
jgi:hypothetical protein